MENGIVDLRNHLFETLEMLKDKENPMDLDRAKTIAEVADKLIGTAKVEVDFLRVTGAKGSGFIPETTPTPLPAPGQKPALAAKD